LHIIERGAVRAASAVQAKPAKRQYAAVAMTISQFEPVTMWADPSVVEEAKQYLADAPNVTVQVGKGANKGKKSLCRV
jgi:agmatine/peptidylarginine deiminase